MRLPSILSVLLALLLVANPVVAQESSDSPDSDQSGPAKQLDEPLENKHTESTTIPVLVLPGKHKLDVGPTNPPGAMLVASSIPSWREFRDDHRPWLTIHADGKVLARPGRKELALYETKMPRNLLAKLKQQIRDLVSDEPNTLTNGVTDSPRQRYGSVTTLVLQIDGKVHTIGWYRSDKAVNKQFNDFHDLLYSIYDAAESGGYERVALDQALVDAELPRLGIHDGIKDVDATKVRLSNCNDCHEKPLHRSGGRWWNNVRFNRWSMEKVFEATVRQDPGQEPFIETIQWRTPSEPAKPLRGWLHDAYTNQPINSFRIIAGTRRGSGWDSGVYKHKTVRAFNDGTFEYKPQWGEGEQYARMEADGYYPEPLPLKNATVVVRLRPETPHASTVVDTAGNPVPGATCALICPDRLASVRDARLEARFPGGDSLADRWRRPAMSTTDQFGQFNLPEDPGVQMVAAAHPEFGLGLMSNRAGSTPITLLPWARLSGCVSAEGKPSVGVKVKVSASEFFEPGEDETYQTSRQHHLAGVLAVEVEMKTDDRGRWAIPKLPAGSYQVTLIGKTEKKTLSVKLVAGTKKNLLARVE